MPEPSDDDSIVNVIRRYDYYSHIRSEDNNFWCFVDRNREIDDDDISLSSMRTSHTKESLYYPLYKPSNKLPKPVRNIHMNRISISNYINKLARNREITCYSNYANYYAYMLKVYKNENHIKNIDKTTTDFIDEEVYTLLLLEDISFRNCDVIAILKKIRKLKYLITENNFYELVNQHV